MKTETYYINELTGEAFTDEVKALATEHLEAKRLATEIHDDFILIQKYCKNKECCKCPFYGTGYEHGIDPGCIINWFDDVYIHNKIGI